MRFGDLDLAKVWDKKMLQMLAAMGDQMDRPDNMGVRVMAATNASRMLSRSIPSLVEDARKISTATRLTCHKENIPACQGGAAFVKAAFGTPGYDGDAGWEVDKFQWASIPAQVLGFQRGSWLLNPDGIDAEQFRLNLFPPEWGSNGTNMKSDGCFAVPGFGLTGADAAEVFEQLGEFESAIVAADADMAGWPFAPLIGIKCRLVQGRCHAKLGRAGIAEAAFRLAISEAKRIGAVIYEALAHRDLIVHVLDDKGTRATQLAGLGSAIKRMVLPPSSYTALLGAGLDAEDAGKAFVASNVIDALRGSTQSAQHAETGPYAAGAQQANGAAASFKGSVLEHYEHAKEAKTRAAAETQWAAIKRRLYENPAETESVVAQTSNVMLIRKILDEALAPHNPKFIKQAGPLFRLASTVFTNQRELLLNEVVDDILRAVRKTTEEAMATTAATLEATLPGGTGPPLERSHLSEDLHANKTYLDWYAQTLIQCGQAELLDEATLRKIDCMFIQPNVGVIRAHIQAKIARVKTSPLEYQAVVKQIAEADNLIYEGIFMKHAKEPAYKSLLAHLRELFHEDDSSNGATFVRRKQPVNGLLALSILVQNVSPTFAHHLQEVIAGVGGLDASCIAFRSRLKSFYRMIEKAQLKGSQLDFTSPLRFDSILDVSGCLISCPDFASVVSLAEAMLARHHSTEHDFTICRVKNTFGSDQGWRKFQINVVIGTVVFEVQVALADMVKARTAFGGHKSYDKFRCFTEIFACLSL